MLNVSVADTKPKAWSLREKIHLDGLLFAQNASHRERLKILQSL